MHRMARRVAVAMHEAILDDDRANSGESDRRDSGRDPDFVVYRISGPFFFGAASMVAAARDPIGRRPGTFVLDLTRVPMADGAAARALRVSSNAKAAMACGWRSARLARRPAHGVNSRVVHFSVDEDAAREYFRLHPEAGAV